MVVKCVCGSKVCVWCDEVEDGMMGKRKYSDKVWWETKWCGGKLDGVVEMRQG